MKKKGIDILEAVYKGKDEAIKVNRNMTHEEILATNPSLKSLFDSFEKFFKMTRNNENLIVKSMVWRDRCFIEPMISVEVDISVEGKKLLEPKIPLTPSSNLFAKNISSIIHVPALRGNPRRTYDISAIGPKFPGTFEKYIASIIHVWQTNSDSRLLAIGESLERLGLTWKVSAKLIDDANVELLVGRLPHSTRGGAKDLVSIADVGFGVSQTLPVLVALLAAESGQLVYIEQPEIHLHPRAQVAMAEILADAAKRGVVLVVETHSALLLQGVQTLVAEGSLSPDLVKFHWFQRRPDGATEVKSADLDSTGAFGEEWPVDFADVQMEAEMRYLDAAEEQLGLT